MFYFAHISSSWQYKIALNRLKPVLKLSLSKPRITTPWHFFWFAIFWQNMCMTSTQREHLLMLESFVCLRHMFPWDKFLTIKRSPKSARLWQTVKSNMLPELESTGLNWFHSCDCTKSMFAPGKRSTATTVAKYLAPCRHSKRKCWLLRRRAWQ